MATIYSSHPVYECVYIYFVCISVHGYIFCAYICLSVCMCECVYLSMYLRICMYFECRCVYLCIYAYVYLCAFCVYVIMVRVFVNGLGDWGSIPGQVIPKTQKMVLDIALLNIQHYKVRIKGKVEQSRERSNTLPYTLV